MQRGCMQRNSRKEGPDVWQFRWSETSLDGKRLYHKKIVGTVEQYPDEDAARRTVVGLVSEIKTDARPMNCGAITVAQLCDHFVQRELSKDNSWRSHATKKIYQAYLTRWIRPHWQKLELADVRTIQVESWLRGLPLAKSSCAKIRNLMSVLFNHACRYELFDRNPISLVRQSAKRRTPPTILVPAEIRWDENAGLQAGCDELPVITRSRRNTKGDRLRRRVSLWKGSRPATLRRRNTPWDWILGIVGVGIACWTNAGRWSLRAR